MLHVMNLSLLMMLIMNCHAFGLGPRYSNLDKIYFECLVMILVIGYVVISDLVKWSFPLKEPC